MIIDVGVCTFRRSSLTATLESLAAQKLPSDVSLRVIVADNDETDSRRADINAVAESLGLSLLYLHAPARNISVARNACLEAATNEWFAFIDDDEVAQPNWLDELLKGCARYDIIFGVSRAIYAADAPRWIVAGDFHSNRLDGNDAPWNGYTANVLMRLAFVNKLRLRFNPDLGLSGGEDTLFFFAANRAGARFGYAPAAMVVEPTPRGRATFMWLAKRRFRSGQIHHLLLQSEQRGARGSFMALLKAGWCLAAAPLSVLARRDGRVQLLRAALHIGVLAAALGRAPYQEYAQSPNDPARLITSAS